MTHESVINQKLSQNCFTMQANRVFFIWVKMLVFLTLAVFLLLFGKSYFSMPDVIRKTLTVLLFLFAALRAFELYQFYKYKNKIG